MRRIALYALLWTAFVADGLWSQLAEANAQSGWTQMLPVILFAVGGYILIGVLAVRERHRNQALTAADEAPTAPSPGPETHVP